MNVALKSDNIILLLTFRTFLRFDGQDFETVGSSQFSHRETFGLGNYRNYGLTTGCYPASACQVKTELMNMETLQWMSGPDFPFSS